MRQWIQEFLMFWKNKYYALILGLSAVLGYGYLVTHHTIGIDDTAAEYYFEEGRAAFAGRWPLFLVNKVLDIAKPAPFVTDLMGVLILLAAATVWTMLVRRIFEEKIPMYGYILFAALFLANPLHSEVFTYYLHNGVAIGYLFAGLGLCFFREGVERPGEIRQWLGCLACMWIAVGCYESFMVVYLVGVCLVLCADGMKGRCKRRVFVLLCIGAAIAVLEILLRSLTVSAVTAVFGLEHLRDETPVRSIMEMAGWMTDPENAGLFGMIVKRIYAMYCVFGYAYYPIKIYVFACVVIGVVCVWMSFRRKNLWISILGVGSFVASYLLALVEGKATLYRSAQFLPLVSAWGCLLAVYAVQGIGLPKIKKAANVILALVLGCILWNQCTDLNRWFYVDDMKYQEAKETVALVAYELEKSFDLSKPVAFTGTYLVPEGIIEDAYVPINSPVHFKMAALTNPVDEYLLSKYYREYGIWVAQTPDLSVIDWGKNAFGDGDELVKFFRMHGHEIFGVKDQTILEEARQAGVSMPHFPKEGSIADMGEYIIVNF